MNEEEKEIKNQIQPKEVITPEQTGKIIEVKNEATGINEKITPEVLEGKQDKTIVETPIKDAKSEEDDNKEGKEDKENNGNDGVNEQSKVQTDTPNEDNSGDNADNQSEDEENVEKVDSEEGDGEAPIGKNEEEKQQEIDIEQVQKELEELKIEKEEAAKVKELVETAQQVEVEYDRVVKGVNEALKETMKQYQIPTDKTLQELAKEDPAKAELARNLILQAKQALDFNTQQLSQIYQNKERDVIFSKAERLFNRYEMSNEQAQVAADTFISIMKETGLRDLDEDLATKVELSVAQAKFKIPSVVVKDEDKSVEKKEVVPPTVEAQAKADEIDEEPAKEEVEENQEEDVEEQDKSVSEEFKIQKRVAVEPPKVDLSGYKEGVEGSGKPAATGADTTNVLHRLASLPPKERQAFLKKNFDLVNKAMKEFNLKNSGTNHRF